LKFRLPWVRETAKEPEAPKRGTRAPRGLSGVGRITKDDTNVGMGMGSPFGIVAPRAAETEWLVQDLDDEILSKLTPQEVIDLLVDLSPEVSKARWDYLRLCNSGWECTVTRPRGAAYPAAQKLVDDILRKIGELHGSVDTVLSVLFTDVVLRGSMLAEVVLDKAGREFVDLATPDPGTIRFMLAEDAIRGQYWKMYQIQNGLPVEIDRPTVTYIPLDPLPGKPYGSVVVSPALFTAVFLIGMLHDLRRVVAQQGWPREDIIINLEQLVNTMPPDLGDDPDAVAAWIQQLVTEVEDAYAVLEPDEAFVHTDVISLSGPKGATSDNALGVVDTILQALERMAIRGLKTMPLLMGVAETTSDAHANRQWEVYMAGIRSLQKMAADVMKRSLEVALRARGILAEVKFEFIEMRQSEKLRDAQTQTIEINNWRAMYAAGWVSQDEAANAMVGHDADEDEPRTMGDVGGLHATTLVDGGEDEPQLPNGGNNAGGRNEQTDASGDDSSTQERWIALGMGSLGPVSYTSGNGGGRAAVGS
jgi:hypothetical protein